MIPKSIPTFPISKRVTGKREILKDMEKPEKNSKPKEEDILFLLEGLMYCKNCKKKMTTKIRQRLGEPVGFYECKEHKIKIANKDVENRVIVMAQDFFKSLINTNLERYFKDYNKRQEKAFQKHINDLEKCIEQEGRKLLRATRKWMHEPSGSRKEQFEQKMLEIEEEIDRLRFEQDKLIKEQKEVMDLPNRTEKIHVSLLNHHKLNEMEHDQIIVLLKDIVSRIDVDKFGADITFKHPYLQYKEVFNEVIK